MQTTGEAIRYRDSFEKAQFEACLSHWERVLEEAEQSDCLFQQIYPLIPTGQKIGKSKLQVLDMIFEKTEIDCICPDEDPKTPYFKNGHSTISMFCDIDIELSPYDLNYGEHADPDWTWEKEDNGNYYKKIKCYRVCLPLNWKERN